MTQKPAGLRVLVIDDEKGLRDMLVYVLSRRGYRVAAVESGFQAAERARTETFDAALCDIMMPGMDGFATLKALKDIQPWTAVILFTGCPTEEDAAKAAELGACDYIAKPCELSKVYAALEKTAESGSGPAPAI